LVLLDIGRGDGGKPERDALDGPARSRKNGEEVLSWWRSRARGRAPKLRGLFALPASFVVSRSSTGGHLLAEALHELGTSGGPGCKITMLEAFSGYIAAYRAAR
jgi:hypothetical protein